MARPKKYTTEEERLEARRESYKKYREKHRDAIKESKKEYKETHKPQKLSITPVIVDGMEVMFTSWDDFLAKTDRHYRWEWAYNKAKFANTGAGWGRPQTYHPKVKLTAKDVLDIMFEAKGRCYYCGSLAVEKVPHKSNGALLPWTDVGRRIGSLDHIKPRVDGGDNNRENLAWCCLWCNTWGSERIKGSTSNGGFYPKD